MSDEDPRSPRIGAPEPELGGGSSLPDIDVGTAPLAVPSTTTSSNNDSAEPFTVAACVDCEAYWPNAGDEWRFCPRCAGSLTELRNAGVDR